MPSEGVSLRWLSLNEPLTAGIARTSYTCSLEDGLLPESASRPLHTCAAPATRLCLAQGGPSEKWTPAGTG